MPTKDQSAKGGKKRAERMTAEQRSAAAREAVLVRWKANRSLNELTIDTITVRPAVQLTVEDRDDEWGLRNADRILRRLKIRSLRMQQWEDVLADGLRAIENAREK